jgi:uncharacterized protein (TIGR02246 family)
MKRLFISIGVLCLVVMSMPDCAPVPESEPEVATEPPFDQEAEEAAVQKVYDEFFAAYNNHDVKAIAASFHDDTLILFEEEVSGVAALEKEYEEIFERNKDAHAERLEEFRTIFLTPTVAIRRGRREYASSHDEEGQHVHPSTGIVAVVLVKKEGQWRWSAIFESHE